ncbi:MAG: ComEC/Rec2 family competence protein [Myxococcaceae bacterium]|nr:ComEC/Rec2 family competence protein [Myxococcaceae bacterium]MBH2005737.1 ComEC/Rec2 family competence protein [Myxococcaceae bacterium]
MAPSFLIFVIALVGTYGGFVLQIPSYGWILAALSGLLGLFNLPRTLRAFALILGIGGLCGFQSQHRRIEFEDRLSRLPKQYERIDGIVEEVFDTLEDGRRIWFRSDRGYRLQVSLREGAALKPVFVGDRLALWGVVHPPQHALAPGDLDGYWFALARHLDGYLRVSNPFKVQVLQTHAEANFWSQQRQKLRNRIQEAGNPRYAAVLLALMIGDTALFSNEQKQIYQRVGAGHLLAVSGLQVSGLSFLFFVILRGILLLIPAIGRRSWASCPAAIFSLSAIWSFVLLSGCSASTVRAALMSSSLLVGLLGERSVSLWDAFGLAGWISVFLWPESVLDPSFTLSYLAIYGILVGGMLGAGVMTLPLSAYYFGALAIGGIVANWILVPVALFLQTPAILLALLGFVSSAAMFAGMIEALCEGLGDYLGGYWYLEAPAPWQVVGSLLGISLFFMAGDPGKHTNS